MTELEIINCQSLGHLIYQVRKATQETGQRVISVDIQSEKMFSFRLVDVNHVSNREWRIRLSAVAHRMYLGVPDPALAEALPDLLAVRTTREVFAEWLSHRLTLEEAAAKCRAHLAAVGQARLGGT